MNVFTNGCFDIIHPGHVDLLERAKSLGTKLIVGINSDNSVRTIKGAGRPFLDQESRKAVLLGLRSVDEVFIFEELTPENLINEIKPEVLVKGGDWKIEEIIGAEFVLKNGGAVYSLPLKGDFSSSKIVDKIRETNANKPFTDSPERSSAENFLKQHLQVFEKLLTENIDSIEDCARVIEETLRRGNKLLLCGNGGGATVAQRLAAEFVERFETERRACPAIALTTDASTLTAIADDYDFDKLFARQIEALAIEGDCLIAFSTSGKSPNIIAAVMKARGKNCQVIGLTGAGGKKLASLCDACVVVPAEKTTRIREAHIAVAHFWCEMIDYNWRET